MSSQIAVRLADEDLARLDWIVGQCSLDSRAEGVRAALAELERRLRRDEIDRQYIEAYTRIPVTDEEMADAERSAIESIREEPWEKWW